MSRVPRRRSAWAWALYDLANTVFSFNILSFYFPVWAKQQGAPDAWLSFAFSGSMVVIAVLAPLLGLLSDRAPRRMPFLVASTLLCVGLTAVLGMGSLPTALVLYAVANVAFQAGLIFYDALLPEVSTPEDVGAVGGLGIGVGYLGSFLGLGTGAVILATVTDPHPWIFAATAALFLLFALPCFLLVRERTRGERLAAHPERGPVSLGQALRSTWATVRTHPGLGRFLLARFLYTDAVNTLILFLGVYATEAVGFTETTAQGILAIGIGSAVLGGLLAGRVVDGRGAARTLQGVLVLWVLVLVGAAAVPGLGLPRHLFWFVAAGAGVALGGTWASDRPLLLRLVPRERVGEFYGVYGMVGRFAAITGPLVWAGVVDGLGLGRPVAVLTLAAAVGVALLVLRPLASADHTV